MTASRRLSQDDPVRRSIAAPPVATRLHECLDEIDRMVVHPLPVLGQLADHAAQHVGRQVRHPDPQGGTRKRVL